MSRRKQGFVITLDGPDGVGKSTQVQLLAEHLKEKGYTVHVTRSSGGTPIGEALREVSLSPMPRPAETDLYISLAMGEALAEDIQRRKTNGEVIIIDRSPLAIIAYNGFGSQLADIDRAYDACSYLFKAYGIDLLLFLTAPSSIVEERRTLRAENNYFENQDKNFHARVVEGYAEGLKFLQQDINSRLDITTIDASSNIDDIQEAILTTVKDHLK